MLIQFQNNSYNLAKKYIGEIEQESKESCNEIANYGLGNFLSNLVPRIDKWGGRKFVFIDKHDRTVTFSLNELIRVVDKILYPDRNNLQSNREIPPNIAQELRYLHFAANQDLAQSGRLTQFLTAIRSSFGLLNRVRVLYGLNFKIEDRTLLPTQLFWSFCSFCRSKF